MNLIDPLRQWLRPWGSVRHRVGVTVVGSAAATAWTFLVVDDVVWWWLLLAGVGGGIGGLWVTQPFLRAWGEVERGEVDLESYERRLWTPGAVWQLGGMAVIVTVLTAMFTFEFWRSGPRGQVASASLVVVTLLIWQGFAAGLVRLRRFRG